MLNATIPFMVNISKITTSEQAYYQCLFQDSNQFIFFILLFIVYSYLIFELSRTVLKGKIPDKYLSYHCYTEFLFSFIVVIFFALQTSFFDLFCVGNLVVILSLIILNKFISKSVFRIKDRIKNLLKIIKNIKKVDL